VSRDHALTIWRAALAAADPEAATSEAARNVLGDIPEERVVLLGVGKACVAMARGLAPLLHDADVRGWLTPPQPASSPIPGVDVMEASHPLPDGRSVMAAELTLSHARFCLEDDLAIALVSGGGSALWCAPPSHMSLEDLHARHDALLASGYDISQMNAARARDSRIKAGRLAKAIHPARLVTFILSDVAGAPPHVVASGPTLPWPDPLPGAAHPPPAPDDPCFARATHHVVADGLIAARAAATAAQELGYDVELIAEPTTDHWSDAADRLMAPLPAGHARIMWGEVRVPLPDAPGRGGRCQHLALAALGRLGPGEAVACLSTDGVDGEGAAGAIVTHGMRAGVTAREADDALARADAQPTLARLGALLPADPTGTNVNDLYVRLGAPR
jgi:hydroxypyruvate reductase